MRRAAAVLARIEARPKWRCANCGKEAAATVHQMRKTYCSRQCMGVGYTTRMAGASNPNFRGAGWKACEQCGQGFHSHAKTRRFCRHECYLMEPMMRGARKDANHQQIADGLGQIGCFVVDLSKLGGGVPDVLVWGAFGWQVLEIKNPATSYGRRGLSRLQKRWDQQARATGCRVHVVRSLDEAIAAVGGPPTTPPNIAKVGNADDALAAIGAQCKPT